MNTESHRLFVEKLNKSYGLGFPLKALKEGAADPDDKIKERYDGDEYLHHFNPSRKPVSVAGNVVWRRVKAARSCWLTGDKARAAHHFGVATHFLTDAFIVSPGIDKDAHFLGDAKFGAAVRGLSPNTIGFPNLGGAGFAEKTLSTTMPLFGCNEASKIRTAFEAAAKMGFCVTEPSVPPELSRWGAAAVKALENQLFSSHQSFAETVQALADTQADTAPQAAADVSGSSRFFRHALAVDEAYARMGERNPSFIHSLRIQARPHQGVSGLPDFKEEKSVGDRARGFGRPRPRTQEGRRRLEATRRLVPNWRDRSCLAVTDAENRIAAPK